MPSFFLCTILSAFVLYSSQIFGDQNKLTLKKEQGVCGKTLSVVFKIGPNISPEFSNAFKLPEEFCDYGRYEEQANYIIYLYNKDQKLVYDKYIYINPLSYFEGLDSKEVGKFKSAEVKKENKTRIIKFPMASNMGEISSYKIESIVHKKVYEMKTIKW